MLDAVAAIAMVFGIESVAMFSAYQRRSFAKRKSGGAAARPLYWPPLTPSVFSFANPAAS